MNYPIPTVFVDGIPDVSHYEKITIDPAMVGPALINKATSGGSFVDSTFYHRAQDIVQAGKLFGAYLFLTGDNINDQMSLFFTTVMGALGTVVADNLKLILDFEDYPANQCSQMQAEQAATTIFTVTRKWPLLYMGRYQIPQPSVTLSKCDLWLPEYGTNPVPAPGFATWRMWQHTDGRAGRAPTSVSGIGPCDVSMFAGSAEQLVAWWAQ